MALTGGSDGELVVAALGETEEGDIFPWAQTVEPMVKANNNAVFQEPAIVENVATDELGNCENSRSSIEVYHLMNGQ